MPGFDGTGPRGLGPMTGRGLGFCAMPAEAAVPAAQSARWFRPLAWLGPWALPLRGGAFWPHRVRWPVLRGRRWYGRWLGRWPARRLW